MPPEIVTPNKAEYTQWRNSTVGQWFFDYWIGGNISALAESMVDGEFITPDNADATAIQTAQAVAKSKTMYIITRISYEDIQEELTPAQVPEEETDGY